MPTLDRPGGSLNYTIEGPDGAPATVVLIHGLCCELADWSAQIATLSPRYRVLACDLRGHGASRFETGLDIHTYGEDVVALLDALSIEQAVLVGHSMGCRVVLETASLAPGRVSGVVLVDGSRFGVDAPRISSDKARAFIVANGGWDSTVRRLFTEMFIEGSDAEYVAAMVERAARVPEDVGSQVFESMATWDATDLEKALDGLQAELMVVQSTYVNTARERVSIEAGTTNPWLDLVREHVPRARIELVAGIGHFTQIEAAEAVSGLIDQMAARD